MFGVGVRSSLGAAKGGGLGLPGLSQAALPGADDNGEAARVLPGREALLRGGVSARKPGLRSTADKPSNGCSAANSIRQLENLQRIRRKLQAAPADEFLPEQDSDPFSGVQSHERHIIGESDPSDLPVTLPEHVQRPAAVSDEVRPFAETAARRRGVVEDPENLAAAADKLAARATPSRPKVNQPYVDPTPDADWDFDFCGDGRPFRFARGKASRIRGGHDIQTTREILRRARAQLCGSSPMELVDRDGILRPAGPLSPFSGLGENGDPESGAHRLFRPEIRAQFRDFIVGWVSQAMCSDENSSIKEGICYVSLGSGELLFDLELLERLRSMGIHIAQVCLIDREYSQPSMQVRRALREFADWQRAVAQFDRDYPAEVYAFGRMDDYLEAVHDGSRIRGCHVLVQCDAHCETVFQDAERLATQTLLQEGLFACLNPEPFLTGQSEAANLPSHEHSKERYSVAAWTLDAAAERRSLQAVEGFLFEACVAAIAAANEAPLSGAAEADRERARAEARVREKSRAQLQEQELAAQLAQKDVDAEIEAQKQIVDAHIAKVKSDTEKVMAARAWREEILEARRVELQEQKLNALVPQMLNGNKKAWIRELEAHGLSLWRVVHAPHVMARSEPKLASPTVGALSAGMEVVAGLTWEGWLQVAQGPTGVTLPEEAWICYDVTSDDQGMMLVQVRSEDLDQEESTASTQASSHESASPTDSPPEVSDRARAFADTWMKEQDSQTKDELRRQELQEQGLTLWRAVHHSQIPIRVLPKPTSKIVALIQNGEELVSGPTYQGWVQVVRGPLRLAELPVEAWVQLQNPGGGWMLKQALAPEPEEPTPSHVPQDELQMESKADSSGASQPTLQELMDAGVSAKELRIVGFTLKSLLNAGFSGKQLKDAGFSLAELKRAGLNISQLVDAGFSFMELRAADFTLEAFTSSGLSTQKLRDAGFPAMQLRIAGFKLKDLSDVGYKLEELKTAGFTAKDMLASGFSVQHLKIAGYNLRELKDAGLGNLQELIDAGVSVKELKDFGFNTKALRAAGLNAHQLKDAGFSANEFKDLGFSIAELKKAGFNLKELRNAGASVMDLKSLGVWEVKHFRGAGVRAAELKLANFSMKELKDGGFTIRELKDGGCNLADLRDAGFNLKQLKVAQFTPQEFRDAGFSAHELRFFGFRGDQLKDAGFAAKELKDADFSVRELRLSGFSVQELQDAGISTRLIRAAGFGLKDLRNAGISISELRIAGFSAKDFKLANLDGLQPLKDGGFKAKDLLRAGLGSLQQLKDVGFDLKELKDAGFDAVELKGAGFVSGFVDAGFTDQELHDAGISVDRIKDFSSS